MTVLVMVPSNQALIYPNLCEVLRELPLQWFVLVLNHYPCYITLKPATVHMSLVMNVRNVNYLNSNSLDGNSLTTMFSISIVVIPLNVT